ncbi:GntR family transcriptional regulator [Streptomyces sp. NBC_01808]|uniref:GntR family transcriptional regulator n=1 Tax=Streptomyces sp. NBC_01808 TaxID=2975947 RepID=UPI002DD9F25C|nr:GntR family transcriptional regulator [Streptomyces sp. NBC_01808]WSA39192.1 GntR family transcriptional regulator [Streptomyces sp. NBC_01808]
MSVDEDGRAVTARARAYEWVKEAILLGRYPEGSFLEEKVLSEAAGVSRTPVREALHRLAAEGFLDLLPRRGAQVRRVTVAEMIETYEMRQVLEIHGFRTLCDKRLEIPARQAELLAQMGDTELLARCRAGDREAIAEHGKLDFQFHFGFVRATGNTVLTDLFRSLQPRHQRIGVSAITIRPERLPLIMREHHALLDSLGGYEFETAARTIRTHLNPDQTVVAHLN